MNTDLTRTPDDLSVLSPDTGLCLLSIRTQRNLPAAVPGVHDQGRHHIQPQHQSTYDWKTKQWSVPINATIAQLVRIGKQSVSIGFGGRYYVATPDFGPHWGVRDVATLLYPKK
jgi:hypothetical protein